MVQLSVLLCLIPLTLENAMMQAHVTQVCARLAATCTFWAVSGLVTLKHDAVVACTPSAVMQPVQHANWLSMLSAAWHCFAMCAGVFDAHHRCAGPPP